MRTKPIGTPFKDLMWGFDNGDLIVTFNIQFLEWRRFQRNGWLPQFYNETLLIYLKNKGILKTDIEPKVNDSFRPQHGYKRIVVTYFKGDLRK